MYKDILNSIDGISVYPVFSFIVFFVFFIGIFTWMIKSNKKQLDEISRLPLDEANHSNSNSIINE